MSELNTLGTAIMFLTRLPVGRFSSGDPLVLSQATRYFPVVGFLVGGVLASCLWLLLMLFPASVSIALLLVISVRLTGAFHEDGLADVADSAGAFDRDKKLEIMRDSRVGTYGALALILLVLIKLLTLWELVRVDAALAMACLVAAHVLSRWSSVFLMVTIPYTRAEAPNKVVAEGVNGHRLVEASGFVVLLLLPLAVLTSSMFYLLLPAIALISALCGRQFKKSFGGITGDCLGAANQVVEVSTYLLVLVVLTWH